jgi:Zn ribbon nucleic-acid-binding protein
LRLNTIECIKCIKCGHGQIKAPAATLEQLFAMNFDDGSTEDDVR